jgi:hypothetical protein
VEQNTLSIQKALGSIPRGEGRKKKRGKGGERKLEEEMTVKSGR